MPPYHCRMRFEALEVQFRQMTAWTRGLLEWTTKPLRYGDSLKLQKAAKAQLTCTVQSVTASDLRRQSRPLRARQSLAVVPTAKQVSVQQATASITNAAPALKTLDKFVGTKKTYNGPERRSKTNRRTFTPHTFWNCLLKPRRFSGRRRSDKRYPLMDAFDTSAMFLAVTLVLLSLTDAFLTLNILAGGGREVNPVMNYMLGFGTLVFVSSKMLMTAVPIAALTAAGNLIIFNCVRVRTVTAILVGMYAGLIVYELLILSMIR